MSDRPPSDKGLELVRMRQRSSVRPKRSEPMTASGKTGVWPLFTATDGNLLLCGEAHVTLPSSCQRQSANGRQR